MADSEWPEARDPERDPRHEGAVPADLPCMGPDCEHGICQAHWCPQCDELCGNPIAPTPRTVQEAVHLYHRETFGHECGSLLVHPRDIGPLFDAAAKVGAYCQGSPHEYFGLIVFPHLPCRRGCIVLADRHGAIPNRMPF